MTPFDDFAYLINHVLLGEEPTVEDFILLVGTLVAFIAFILWCCFPVQPKEVNSNRQLACSKSSQHSSGQINHYNKHNSPAYNYGLKNGHSYHCT